MVEPLNLLLISRTEEGLPENYRQRLLHALESPSNLQTIQEYLNRIWDASLADEQYDTLRAIRLLIRKII